MKNIIKSTYYIKNLDCANCAAKIERKLNNLEIIDHAELNFINKKLTLEFIPETSKIYIQSEDFFNFLSKTITDVESGVFLTKSTSLDSEDINVSNCSHEHNPKDCHTHEHDSEHSHTHEHNSKNSKLDFILLILGTFLSASAIILNFSSPFYILAIIGGYLLIGHKILITSFKNILHGEIFDENFLVVVATAGALITGEYPEAIAVILLFQIGEMLQGLAVNKSRKQLSAVMNIKPEYANIQTNNGIETVPPEKVSIGQIIVVKPSEKIPLDGIVTDGSSFIDTSSITGESVPRKVSKDDTILSGCINGSGTLFVKVTSAYENSTVAKVLDMVENANSRKSATENFITKFARVYTPIVVLAALILAILPPIISGTFDFSPWIYKACGFLVVSCPCALVISIPLGFFGGIGCASSKGILIKGSNYLEALNNIDTAVFDKTGTLTKGEFKVNKITATEDFINYSKLSKKEAENELLKYAALIESFSTHPIAKSIVSTYTGTLDTSSVSDYKEISGCGIQAKVDAKTILAGNPKLLSSNSVLMPDNINENGTVVYLSIDNIYAGYIVISDIIKEDSKTAIAALKALGIKSIMLTGDVSSAAKAVADSLGIDEVYSQLLPTDKVEKVEEFLEISSKNNKKVIFTGDGINDAPVLARADVGIAMGGVGSDAAVEAADIVIMTDEPSKIVYAIKIARNTRKIVIENIILALGVKFIVMVLLAIGIGSMWLAVFADVGVSLIAIVNSIRALKYK